MKLKMPSAHTVMRRIISMPAHIEDQRFEKQKGHNRLQWPAARSARMIAAATITQAERIEAIAGHLLEYRQQRGRWPNEAVRWMRKDRIWNRAMRLAKKRWDANPVPFVWPDEE